MCSPYFMHTGYPNPTRFLMSQAYSQITDENPEPEPETIGGALNGSFLALLLFWFLSYGFQIMTIIQARFTFKRMHVETTPKPQVVGPLSRYWRYPSKKLSTLPQAAYRKPSKPSIVRFRTDSMVYTVWFVLGKHLRKPRK